MSPFQPLATNWPIIYLAFFATKAITALRVLSQGAFLTTLCSFKGTFLRNKKSCKTLENVIFQKYQDIF